MRIAKADLDRAVDRFLGGMNIKRACAGICSPRRFNNELRQRGIDGQRNKRTTRAAKLACRRYLTGKNLTEAADGLCSVGALIRYMRREGIPRRSKLRLPVNPERSLALFVQWRNGKTYRDIARQHGHSYTWAYQQVQRGKSLWLDGFRPFRSQTKCGTVPERKRAA